MHAAHLAETADDAASSLELAVLIPTYGRPQAVAELCDRLDAQNLSPQRFEVVVVDDGSPEPVTLDPSAYSFRLTVLRQPNAGPAAARNRGLEVVMAPLVLILNDDAVPEPELCAEHLAAHAGRTDRVAVLGTFEHTAESLRHPFVQVLAKSDLLFDFVRLRDGELHDWRFFWTCNLSIATAALRAVGGFDAENFDSAIVEDVELGYRLEQRGYRVLHHAAARCGHDHEIGVDAWIARASELGKYKLRMWQKHGDPSLLSQPAGTVIDEHFFGKIRVLYEHGYPRLTEFVECMRTIEREHYGEELSQELLQSLRAAARSTITVPMARGIVFELSGFDPEPILARGATPGLRTTVIVVCHDAADQTRACLERLRAADDPRYPTALFFVENGSSDGTADFLAAQTDVTLIANETNLGAPRARNQALALAAARPGGLGDAVAFLDSDAMVEPGWLERLLYHLEVDPFCACVGPRSDRAAHGAQVVVPGRPTAETFAAYARELARDHHREYRDAAILSSFCLVVRAELIHLVGGFDERFSPWGYEDDDFTLRCLLAGYMNRLANDVFVRHEPYGGPKARHHLGLLGENWRRFAAKWQLDADDTSCHDRRVALALAREWHPAYLHCPLPEPPQPGALQEVAAVAGVAPLSGR